VILMRQRHSFNLFSGSFDLLVKIAFARTLVSCPGDRTLGRFECQIQRIQLPLEFGLAFLDDFESQLIPVKLDCGVMNVPFDFGYLSLRLAKCPLQLGLSAF